MCKYLPSPDFPKLNCVDERRLLQIPGKAKLVLKCLIFPGFDFFRELFKKQQAGAT